MINLCWNRWLVNYTVATVCLDFSSDISDNTPVSFAVVDFLCYGLRRGESRNDFAGRLLRLVPKLELHHKG